jgi:hypothetical protein
MVFTVSAGCVVAFFALPFVFIFRGVPAERAIFYAE